MAGGNCKRRGEIIPRVNSMDKFIKDRARTLETCGINNISGPKNHLYKIRFSHVAKLQLNI